MANSSMAVFTRDRPSTAQVILLRRDGFDVVGIYAEFVTAKMIGMESVGNQTLE